MNAHPTDKIWCRVRVYCAPMLIGQFRPTKEDPATHGVRTKYETEMKPCVTHTATAA